MLKTCSYGAHMHCTCVVCPESVCISSDEVHSKWISSEASPNGFTDNPVQNFDPGANKSRNKN